MKKYLSALFIASIFSVMALPVASAEITTIYPFDVPANYVISDEDLVEIVGGEATTQIVDEEQINESVVGTQSPDHMVQLPDGNILVVMTSSDTTFGTDNDISLITAKVIDSDAKTVVNEFQVNQTITGFQAQAYASVADLGGGNASIFFTWLSTDSSGGLYGGGSDTSALHVVGRVMSYDGSSITGGTDFQVNVETDGSQLDAKSVAYNDGVNDKFLVTWTSNDLTLEASGGTYIAARTFDTDGTNPSAEFVINDPSVNNEQYPFPALLSNGDIVITYDGNSNILFKILDNANLATEIQGETQVSATTAAGESFPQVVELHTNDLFFGWVDADDGDNYGVSFSIYEQDGTPVIAETLINNVETEGRQESLYLSTIEDPFNAGNKLVFATYTTEDTDYGTDIEVVGKVLTAIGGTYAGELQLNEFTTDEQISPVNVATSAGTVMVAWESESIADVSDNDSSYVAAKPFGEELTELYPTSFPYVQPASSLSYTEKIYLFNHTIDLGLESEGPFYQISDDNGATWYYYTGGNWVTTTSTNSEFNTLADLANAIQFFQNPGDFLWRAYFSSDNGISNGKDRSALQEVDVRENEPPVIISEAGSATVNKTLSPGDTLVSVLEYEDPESLTIDLALTGPDAALFDVQFSLGGDEELFFLSSNPPSDDNTDGIYEVTVEITDLYGAIDTQDFLISFSTPSTGGGGGSGSSSTKVPSVNPFSGGSTGSSTSDGGECSYEKTLKEIEQFRGFDREVSRFEALEYVLIINCIGLDELPEDPADYPFLDINLESERLARVLYTGYNRGIVKGYPNGTYKPADTVNYVELLAINSRAQGLADDSEESGEQWFSSYINLSLTIQLALNNIDFGDPIKGDTFYLITKTFLDS